MEKLTIKETNNLLLKKDISVKELVDKHLEVIKEKYERLGVFLEIFSDIEENVKNAQNKIDEGNADLLTGIPIAIKDNILMKGKVSSAASKIIENYTAPYDSTVISKLKKNNPIFIGRVNMDEFAMGSSTENSAFQTTKNPHDNDRVPGGSSGGSATAVSSGMTPISLGSDTGGSIRQPASFCGCVGLKPTYGAVSRFGLIAMGSSLDQIGPLGMNVSDVEDVFYQIEGYDPLDSTTYGISERKKERLSSKAGKRIGVPWHLIENGGISKVVLDNFKSALKKLEDRGYEVEDISLPHTEHALNAYYIITPAEVSSNMARFDGMRYGKRVEGKDLLEEYENSRELLGKEVKSRIMIGTYVLSAGYYDAYYNKAHTVRRFAREDFKKVFGNEDGEKGIDIIATPTTPTSSFKIGDKINDPLEMYMADIFTVSANITGVPAISIPSGNVKEENGDMPAGLQLMAPWLREDVLFGVSKDFLK